MVKLFQPGDRVTTTHGPPTDPADRRGAVERHYDWWVMVKLDKTGIVMPFMAGELEHETTPTYVD